MPELVLLSLDRAHYLALDKAAKAGDVTAAETIGNMWDQYDGTDIECFICGAAPVPRPIHAVLVPDYDPATLLACPTCETCRALPLPLRTHKILKLLRKMWSKRFKKDVHFIFNKSYRQPHPQ